MKCQQVDNFKQLHFAFTPKLLFYLRDQQGVDSEGLTDCSIRIDPHNQLNWPILADFGAERPGNDWLARQSSPKQMRSDVERNRRDCNAKLGPEAHSYCCFKVAKGRTLHFIESIPGAQLINIIIINFHICINKLSRGLLCIKMIGLPYLAQKGRFSMNSLNADRAFALPHKEDIHFRPSAWEMLPFLVISQGKLILILRSVRVKLYISKGKRGTSFKKKNKNRIPLTLKSFKKMRGSQNFYFPHTDQSNITLAMNLYLVFSESFWLHQALLFKKAGNQQERLGMKGIAIVFRSFVRRNRGRACDKKGSIEKKCGDFE